MTLLLDDMLVNSDTLDSELFISILVKAGQVFMDVKNSLNRSCNMKHIVCPVHFSHKPFNSS